MAQAYEGEVLAAALARAGGEADSSGAEASGATEQVEPFAVIRYSESSLPRGLGTSRLRKSFRFVVWSGWGIG